MIALVGNLARDLLPGAPPRAGGGPTHGARALQRLGTPARVYARCAEADRETLFEPLAALGVGARYVPGTSTACFELSYTGERRVMRLLAPGDSWRPDEAPRLPAAVSWVHVAPLLRSDFPAETLAVLAAGRRILLDGQGLVRAASAGPLVLDADYDPGVFQHLAALKLAEDAATVLGDPGALPVAEILVTHGSAGATIYADGRVERVSSDPVDTDPTGAGDAFCVAYASARAAGHAPVDAAQLAANLVSALLKER